MLDIKKTINYIYLLVGGVEQGQTLYTAAENEALEEIGVQIKNPVLIEKQPFISDWYKLEKQGIVLNDQIKKHMKYLRGQKIYFMKAEFDKIDKKYYGRDNDAMTLKVISKSKLIQEFKKYYDKSVSLHRIKIVGML